MKTEYQNLVPMDSVLDVILSYVEFNVIPRTYQILLVPIGFSFIK